MLSKINKIVCVNLSLSYRMNVYDMFRATNGISRNSTYFVLNVVSDYICFLPIY